MAEIAAAVGFLHERSIIHFDLVSGGVGSGSPWS